MKKFFIITGAAVLSAALLGGCSLPGLFNNNEGSKVEISGLPNAEELTVKYNGYGFAALTSLAEKRLYAGIDATIDGLQAEEFITESLEDPGRISDVLEFYKDDHPDVFWVDETEPYYYSDENGALTVCLNFKLTGEELASAKAELEATLQEAVSKAPQGATPYELELYAHNYLIGVCDYDEEAVELHKSDEVRSNEQNAYGALVEGKAVCEGYTRAFQLLCDRLSVPCWVIQGQAEGFDGEGNTNHIWNCVMLDGDWYQVDVTWDDYDSNPTVGDEQYFYFNLTTAEMLKDHIIAPSYNNYQSSDNWYNGFVPECTATKYYYFKLNGMALANLDDYSLSAYVAEAAFSNREYCVFVVDESRDFNETYDSIVQEYAYQWITQANEINGYPRLSEACKLSAHEDRRLITLLMAYE